MAVLSCDNAASIPNSRNQIRAVVNSPTAAFTDDIQVDISAVGPAGPWTLANTTSISCNPEANPTSGGGIAHPGSARFISGLTANTPYWVRWTITAGPDAPEELVCGPITTYDFPTFLCVPNGIGSNEVNILEGSFNPNGRANLGPAICPQDTYLLEYGTTSGVYTQSIPGVFDGYSPEILVMGLAQKTTYYFRFTAYDENMVPYFVGDECSITTLAISCGENVGADWETVEYGYNDAGYGHTFTQSWPPGTGSTVA